MTLWNAPIYAGTHNVLAYSDTLLPVAPVFGVLERLTGSPELTSGEGIFVEELHAELGRRGITVRVAGETHAIPGHDEAVQRAGLESVLEHRDA